MSALFEYRNSLIAAEQKSQDAYDKTIVSLSGGALALSLLFIKDIVGANSMVAIWAIMSAWCLWGASLLGIVSSHYISQQAYRIAINDLDAGKLPDQPGGWCAPIIQLLNLAAGLSFLIGVAMLIIFVSQNLGSKHMKDEKPQEAQFVAPPTGRSKGGDSTPSPAKHQAATACRSYSASSSTASSQALALMGAGGRKG